MKKWFALAVLAVSLGIVPVAHAQFYDNSPCNVSPSGKIAGRASGVNGAVVTRLSIHYNYATKDHVVTDRTDATANIFVGYLNERAINQKDIIRFEMSPFDPSASNLNVTMYLEVYNRPNGTYPVFISVNGWGVGHMFNTRATDLKDVSDPSASMITALNQVENMLQNGWVCSSD